MQIIAQQIIKHKNFLPNDIIYGFLGKHPDIATYRYRNDKNAAANRKIILNIFGSNHSHISLLKQTHSTNCIELTFSEDIDCEHEGDAQITKNENIILAVQTADCVPILLVDQATKVIAAIHAGWKGALAGVTDTTLNMMVKSGANINNIIAIIGPCIRQNSYEVSGDFISQFLLEDISNSRFFKKNITNKDKYFFDLPGYVKNLLARSHIKAIYDTGIDTLTYPNFFSYRRACLSQNKLDGCNLSLIGLK